MAGRNDVVLLGDPRVEEFRGEVRGWLADAIPARWREGRDSLSDAERFDLCRDWERTLWSGGYAGLDWPVEHGGRDLDPVRVAVFYEELARAQAPEIIDTIGKFLAGPAILAHGTDAQKARFLPTILNGSDLWCEGFSEPEAGSDMAAIRTTAVRVGDGSFRIEGQKLWTSKAHKADWCYLLARTSLSARRHHNLSVFLLDMHQPQITVRPIRQITGEERFCEVFFEGARAVESDILGTENEGWFLGTLLGFRSRRHVVDALARYVELRQWLDQLEECCAIGAARLRFTELDVRLEALHWHVLRAAELLARGDEDCFGTVSVLRICWTELSQAIADYGMTLGCPEHEHVWDRRYLESRAATIRGGTAQLQRNVIARRVLGLPR